MPQNINAKFAICAPVGGFGNHLRWLTWANNADKLSFIQKEIYPTTRTWNNWLDFEWRHREFLDEYMLFRHKIIEIPDIPTVIITIDPSLSVRNYLKFNPNLGMATIENFCQSIEENNRHNLKFSKTKNNIIVPGELLWNPLLDQHTYQSVMLFFGLEPNQKIAQKVHGLWWAAQKRSEKEIVQFLTNFYKE